MGHDLKAPSINRGEYNTYRHTRARARSRSTHAYTHIHTHARTQINKTLKFHSVCKMVRMSSTELTSRFKCKVLSCKNSVQHQDNPFVLIFASTVY